jgi:glycosyltransferase involved in cell wall biosynthesis
MDQNIHIHHMSLPPIRPYFSILIPCFNRPELAKEALHSALRQEFVNYEIIISNNGNSSSVNNALSKLIDNPKVQLLQITPAISMPDHWEYLRKHAKGEYILVLTDRSVLKQHALKKIYEAHVKNPNVKSVVSWPWELFYNDEKIAIKYVNVHNRINIIDSKTYLTKCATYADSGYPYALPRGLNSCISAEVLNKISCFCGSAFGLLNPDFSVGFRCLHTVNKFIYLGESLMVSQGLKESNGGNSSKGDGSEYIRAVGLNMEEAFSMLPIKLPFVASGIAQDLLMTLNKYQNTELLNKFNWGAFYNECLKEAKLKQSSSILSKRKIETIFSEINLAISKETSNIKFQIQKISPLKMMVTHYKDLVLRLVYSKFPITLKRITLKARGGKHYKSALDVK